jgi:NAD(P)-dependent dehydrogenase (short-subunit alcohol dehydrogenase family)
MDGKLAALVTGGSRGIGLAIAETLAEEGHDLTIAARGRGPLDEAAARLLEHGVEIEAVVANLADERDIVGLVNAHRQRFGRLDVLVNNAGIGIRGQIDGFPTKHMDLLWSVNLRSVMLAYRESMDMLREAGRQEGQALVVNVSSISGKVGAAELSIYAATKHGVVGFTDSMNRELYHAGIRSTVLCPGFVDTPLSDYAKPHIAADDMITVGDLGEAVRLLLRTSSSCVIPEITFMQGEALGLQVVPLDGAAVSRN